MTPLQNAPELGALSSVLRSAAPVQIGALTVVPILGKARVPDVDLLDESVREGRTEVNEISEGGSVPVVKVTHRGPLALLLLDGEILVGAKQNRVLNASLLVPAGATVDAPVSCVEKGRWRYDASSFGTSPATLIGKMRSAKLRRVAGSVAKGAGYDADQAAVWREVDAHLEETATSSRTSSYTDSHAARAAEIERLLPRLAPSDDQLGFASLHGGRIVAVDVFGSARVFKRAWSRIARGMLGEVFDAAVDPPRDADRRVEQLLACLGDAQVVRKAAPGSGETLHGELGPHAIGAVVDRGRVFHVTLG